MVSKPNNYKNVCRLFNEHMYKDVSRLLNLYLFCNFDDLINHESYPNQIKILDRTFGLDDKKTK